MLGDASREDAGRLSGDSSDALSAGEALNGERTPAINLFHGDSFSPSFPGDVSGDGGGVGLPLIQWKRVGCQNVFCGVSPRGEKGLVVSARFRGILPLSLGPRGERGSPVADMPPAPAGRAGP